MVLSSKVKDAAESGAAESVTVQIPDAIRALFDEDLVTSGDHRRLYVTLGQFSIVRLELCPGNTEKTGRRADRKREPCFLPGHTFAPLGRKRQ